MKKKENNFAFIDSQNLNLGVRGMGWKLDFKRFRVYLKEKYAVGTAYLFIGYVPGNESLYKSLQQKGYILILKPTIPDGEGRIKGNVDADLVLWAMIEFNKYDKALIVSSDGDFYSLAGYLYDKNKLRLVMSPHKENCSTLLRHAAKEKIVFMDNLKEKLGYKEKAPPKDRP